jgi:predicted MFS family arabinose efflux permease
MTARIIRLYKEAYAGLPRGAWLLACADFVNRTGFMVLVFLNIYLTRHLHFSLAQAGHVLSGYGVGAIAGGYLGGYLADRIAPRRVMIGSLVLSGGLLIAAGYASTYGAILVLIFCYGIAATALFPANDTAMSRFCQGELRAKGFALRRLASNLGITFGPVVGGYLILIDYRWIFWADGLTSLAAAAVIAVFMGLPSAPLDAKAADAVVPGEAAPSPWKDGAYLKFMGLFLIVATVFAQIFSTFPLYLNVAYGLKENRIGPLWAVNTLMIVTIEMVLLHRLRKKSPMAVISAGACLLGMGFALLPLGRTALFAAFTVAVWTMGEILTMPLTATVASTRAGATSAGRYLGLLSLVFSLSMFIGPLAGNALYGAAGGTGLWLIAGASSVVAGGGFWLMRHAMAARTDR